MFRHGSRLDAAAMRIRLIALVVTTVALALPAAASADLTWSGPNALDHNGTTSLMAVACPTSTQCTAVDQISQQVTFSPSSGAGTSLGLTSPGAEPDGIACPSAHQCTQVDDSGEETTF